MSDLQTLLESGKPILLDGAMGTMLMDAGLESGDPPEEWNQLYPDRVRNIHKAYIEAGSQIILTNSFGGTSFRLEMHQLQDRVIELNQAAARNARAEADAVDRVVLVAGSIGPTGQLFEPMGTLSYDQAVLAFKDQAAGLSEGAVDLFWIETMSDLQEVKAAVDGIRQVSQLPISATMSFDTHGHTMMGVKPEAAALILQEMDLFALGANCGTGSDELIVAIQKMREAAPDSLLVAKANAGIPQVVGTEVVYNGSPQVMAEYAGQVFQSGARLIGGCCGNTPAHVKAMAEALQIFG